MTKWPYVLVGKFDNDPGVSFGKPTIIRSQSLPGHEKLLLALVASIELSDIQAVKQSTITMSQSRFHDLAEYERWLMEFTTKRCIRASC